MTSIQELNTIRVEFMTSNTLDGLPTDAIISTGRDSIEALQNLLTKVSDPVTREYLNECLDFELTDPLHVAYQLSGRIYAGMDIRPILFSEAESGPLSAQISHDDIIAATIMDADDLPRKASKELVDEVTLLIQRNRTLVAAVLTGGK